MRATRMLLGLLVIVGVFVMLAQRSTAANPSRGFNDNIEWRNDLDIAKEEARVSGKPIFLLIHKTWCGACKNLKKQFVDSDALEQASESFVMVNLEDDEEPQDPEFKPDGGYIPRLLFLDSQGKIHSEIFNEEGNPKYKYFYTSASQIVSGMKRALKKLNPKGDL